MKLKLALFKDTALDQVIWPKQYEARDKESDLGERAIRVSQWVEIDFPALSEAEITCHLESYRHRELKRNRERREALLAQVMSVP